MSEKEINDLLKEIGEDKDGIGYIECGTQTNYIDNNQYQRIKAAISQNIDLQKKIEELNKKVADGENQNTELNSTIEKLKESQKKNGAIANNLIKAIQEYLLDNFKGQENEYRFGDYIFITKKDHVDFKYEPIKEKEPFKLELMITENSDKTKICPICHKKLDKYPAISRKDNKTEICSKCGMNEAIEIFNKYLNEQKSE